MHSGAIALFSTCEECECVPNIRYIAVSRVTACSMIMVSANETFKKILNPSGEMNVTAYVASGAMAGALVRICNPHLNPIMALTLSLCS